MKNRTSLSSVDAAWLRMDSATNPMVITAMLTLDGPLGRRELDDLVARIVRSERFRQRAKRPRLGLGVSHWEEDPHFDPTLHVHRIALPPPSDHEARTEHEALADLVSDRMSAPLDPTRPLWQLHVVEGLAKGRTALVARVHHCVGDGVALVRQLLAIAGVDAAPGAAAPPSSHQQTDGSDRAPGVAERARALRKLLLLPADPATSLKGEPSRRKRAAWSRAISLEGLKRSAHALGATVNDVLLASTTASLRRYLLARDARTHPRDVHAIVPVFLGGAARDVRVGNHFGLIFLALPIGCSPSRARVRIIKQRMDAIKATPEARVAFAILAAAGIAGATMERGIVDIFTRKGSVMVTNVAGPPAPLSIAGRRLEEVVVWAPSAGHLALSVSFVSYAGVIRMGVMSDPAIVPEPQAIVDEFERDAAELFPAGVAEGVSSSRA